MRIIHSGLIVALNSWSDLLGCHAGVRAGVLRGMPAGIPTWQAKSLLHGALDKVHHLRRRPLERAWPAPTENDSPLKCVCCHCYSNLILDAREILHNPGLQR